MCIDEASKQLLGHATGPLPTGPGVAAREDYHYTRGGVRSVFMFFAPLLGWRRVASIERRTRLDRARVVKRLADEDFPDARKIVLVCDNLNTHHVASLYEAFGPEEVRRIARRLEIHYTPRNSSWLNVVEVELGVPSGQCRDRRIASGEEFDREVAAWQPRRNAEASKVTWQFTADDARVKLRRLYLQL